MPYMPIADFLNYGSQCYAFSEVWIDTGCTEGTLFQYEQLYPASVDPYFNYQGNMNIGEIAENSAKEPSKFWYQLPRNSQDALGSRQCVVSGWWAPASCLTWVDGQPMIIEFARLPESQRIARNKHPKDWHIG